MSLEPGGLSSGGGDEITLCFSALCTDNGRIWSKAAGKEIERGKGGGGGKGRSLLGRSQRVTIWFRFH